MASRPQKTAGYPLSQGQNVKVRETLDRVLASQAFRKSDQCQKFLRYVVEHSQSGEDELLRERNIGMEVFGRPPDYDTGDDPIVRVRATEVRKRLAQYHGESPAGDDVRFEIPAGSYRVEFHWPDVNPSPGEAAVPVHGTKLRRRRLIPAFAAVVVVGIAGAFLIRRVPSPPTMVDEFWAPVFASPKPVLIYCGQPVVYFLSRDIHDKYRRTLPAEKQRGAYVVALGPDTIIRGRDVIPVTDQFVGIGNAQAAVLLATLMATKHKPVEIRYANDLSFSDLRSSPSVLIGAFSNYWTLEMQGQLRFVFEQDQGVRRIRDRSDNRTWQLTNLAPDGKTPEDFAVVSRLFHSETGKLLISAAGITQYGTRAAGEFLTEASLLKQALAKGPADWATKNVQVLLQTTVYRGTPGTPRVIATHVW